MIELPRMSHSRFQMYSECGEKYRLARIEKVPTTPGIYRVAGTAFHEWTDMFDTSPPWDTEIPHAEWYVNRMDELIKEEEEKSGFEFAHWDNPAHGKDANQKALDKFRSELGPDMISKYIEWRANSAWSIADLNGVPGIEYELFFTIQGVENICKIDRVFEIPETGELVAIDTKTWSRRRVTAQLPTYLVALRRAGFNVTRAGYYHARKGEVGKLESYRYWNESRLAALHVQAAHMIGEQWFLPRPSDDCRLCDVRRHCCFYLD